MKSNVSHLLASVTAMVNALRASGEVLNDGALLAQLDALNSHAFALNNSYHRWWQTWQRTSTRYNSDEAGQRNQISLQMERLSAKGREVVSLIEIHANRANESAHDQSEQFTRQANFNLSDILWSGAKLIPLMIETLSAAVGEKVSHALSLQTSQK